MRKERLLGLDLLRHVMGNGFCMDGKRLLDGVLAGSPLHAGADLSTALHAGGENG